MHALHTGCNTLHLGCTHNKGFTASPLAPQGNTVLLHKHRMSCSAHETPPPPLIRPLVSAELMSPQTVRVRTSLEA